MTEPKNLKEYVAQEVIAYLNSDDKKLIDRINSSAILKKFTEEVDIGKLEEYASFLQSWRKIQKSLG